MDYKAVIRALNDMESEGVVERYAIGGAVAAIFHKIEIARTEDIDIFITLTEGGGSPLDPFRGVFDYLRSRGYEVNDEGYSIIGGWKVQLLPPTSPLDAEALAEAQDFEVDDMSVRVFSLEHLMAIALNVGRQKDKLRIPEFKKSKSFDAQRFSDILARHKLMERWEKLSQFLDA